MKAVSISGERDVLCHVYIYRISRISVITLPRISEKRGSRSAPGQIDHRMSIRISGLMMSRKS